MEEKDFILSYKQKHLQIKSIWMEFESNPESLVNKEVSIRGFIHTFRFAKSGKMAFLHIVDGSTVRSIQCICDSEPDDPKDSGPIDFKPLFEHLNRDATLSLTGIIVKSPAPKQPIEFVVKDYKLWGQIVDPDKYPLASRGTIDRETLRKLPHLNSKFLPLLASMMVKTTVFKSIHQAMAKMGINEIQPTILTGNECESGAFPFTVTTLFSDRESGDMVGKTSQIPTDDNGRVDFKQDFFGHPVYLTVSSQLHGEAKTLTMMQCLYWMTKAFRAEPSKGPMHLAELVMPEWELIDCDLYGNMDVAEKVIKHCILSVLKDHPWELQLLEEYEVSEVKREYEKQLAGIKSSLKSKKITKKEFGEKKTKLESWFQKKQSRLPLIQRLQRYGKEEWIRTSHKECVRLMLKDVDEGRITFEELPGYDKDLSREHEHYITDVLFEDHPVYVKYFPKEIKGFYMPVIKEDYGDEPKIEHVDCYDLLMPGLGEVVGASQRIHDHDELVKRMDELNMNKEALQWYIDLRKYGSVPHGGGGLGMGRLMMLLTGFLNIRDLEEFARAYGMQCFA